MQRTLSLAALLILWFAVSAVSASARQVYTGENLVKNCKDEVTCRTYLSGLLDADETLTGWYQLTPQFCLPAPQTPDTLWPVVKAFLEKNPEQLKFTAGSVTLIALENAYRCPAGARTAASPLTRYFSGSELTAVCLTFELCQAFVIGVMDAHQSLTDWKRIRPLVCLPPDVENPALLLATSAYIGAHPNELNYTAGSLILLGLAAKYPCP